MTILIYFAAVFSNVTQCPPQELYFRGSLRDIPTNTYLPAILRQRLNTDLWDNLMLKQDKKFQNIFKKFRGHTGCICNFRQLCIC